MEISDSSTGNEIEYASSLFPRTKYLFFFYFLLGLLVLILIVQLIVSHDVRCLSSFVL
jgi:hypothetical protein